MLWPVRIPTSVCVCGLWITSVRRTRRNERATLCLADHAANRQSHSLTQLATLSDVMRGSSAARLAGVLSTGYAEVDHFQNRQRATNNTETKRRVVRVQVEQQLQFQNATHAICQSAYASLDRRVRVCDRVCVCVIIRGPKCSRMHAIRELCENRAF